MRIVVLDGYTLNPGDLSWCGLEEIGDLTVHDRTPADQTAARAAGAEIVLTNKTPLSADLIDRLDSLRYVGVLATGYNCVDVAAARRRNIPVTNVPEYGTRSVAQMVFAHILHHAQHVADHARSVRAGEWTDSPDFCFWQHPLVELDGLILGIVGFGRIGRATAELAQAFGMEVLAHDVSPPASGPPGVAFVDLPDLFGRSDFVTLHCPLTPDNERFVDADLLGRMKRGAYFVNTSRGPLVDEQALADALNAGRIAGAGLDVLSSEPPAGKNPLLTAKNCSITPHIAWATRSARERLMRTAVENVRGFLAGQPQNVVNGVEAG